MFVLKLTQVGGVKNENKVNMIAVRGRGAQCHVIIKPQISSYPTNGILSVLHAVF
jgi:hypothetical protein